MNTGQYAIITATHESFGQIDIRVSRDLQIREIILYLFDALGCDQTAIQGGCYAKTGLSKILLSPSDTLTGRGIYDGEILRIL